MAPKTLTEILAQIAQRNVEHVRDGAMAIVLILWIAREMARCNAYAGRLFVRECIVALRTGLAWGGI